MSPFASAIIINGGLWRAFRGVRFIADLIRPNDQNTSPLDHKQTWRRLE